MNLADLVAPALTGLGTGALGLVTGAVHSRSKRIARLEKEVEECRERDARFLVVEAGLRAVVGEMIRDNPNSLALAMCGDLLNRKLGPAPDTSDLTDLLRELDRAPFPGAPK